MRFLCNGQHILDIGDSVIVLLLDALFVAFPSGVHFGFRGLAERGELLFQCGYYIGKGIPINGIF